MLAKLCKLVPLGYSKSLDKIRVALVDHGHPEILQFLDNEIEDKFRYLPELISESPRLEEQKKEEDQTIIRFANYTQLLRASNGDANKEYSGHLMALIGGYLTKNQKDDADEICRKKDLIIDKSDQPLPTKAPNVGAARLNSWEM